MRLASASKNRCIGISVWWIEVQQAIMRWNKCIWANYSCFFSLSCVCFFILSPIAVELYNVHTHILSNMFFLHSPVVCCVDSFFFLNTLFCFSVGFFFFVFFHCSSASHWSLKLICLSLCECECVCVWEYTDYMYVYIASWTDQHRLKYVIKDKYSWVLFVPFFPRKKKRLVLWEIFDWFQFEIGAFCTQSETICQWILTRCNFVYNRCFTISAWHKCLGFDFSIEFIIKSKPFTQLTWIILNYLNFWTFNFAKFQARNS